MHRLAHRAREPALAVHSTQRAQADRGVQVAERRGANERAGARGVYVRDLDVGRAQNHEVADPVHCGGAAPREDEIETLFPGTLFPNASFAVTMIVAVVVPSATIEPLEVLTSDVPAFTPAGFTVIAFEVLLTAPLVTVNVLEPAVFKVMDVAAKTFTPLSEPWKV